MYNIAITKEKKTKFFNGNDDKPRSYPTLADALVSAQYLGLNKQEGVELHFIMEGTSVDAVTQTTSTITPPADNAVKEKQEADLNSGDNTENDKNVENNVGTGDITQNGAGGQDENSNADLNVTNAGAGGNTQQ
jgi:hypothetical protein